MAKPRIIGTYPELIIGNPIIPRPQYKPTILLTGKNGKVRAYIPTTKANIFNECWVYYPIIAFDIDCDLYTRDQGNIEFKIEVRLNNQKIFTREIIKPMKSFGSFERVGIAIMGDERVSTVNEVIWDEDKDLFRATLTIPLTIFNTFDRENQLEIDLYSNWDRYYSRPKEFESTSITAIIVPCHIDQHILSHLKPRYGRFKGHWIPAQLIGQYTRLRIPNCSFYFPRQVFEVCIDGICIEPPFPVAWLPSFPRKDPERINIIVKYLPKP